MKTNTFKYIFYIVLITLIVFAIYFLYKGENNNSLAIEDNSLNLNIQNEINIGIINYDTINPILTKNKEIQYITKLVFDPLIDITKDFKLENKLAKEFSKINSTTYIIKLKENVLWHDNTKLTSNDVIFTINNLKKINSIYNENVKYIKEVEQIDEYTLKIKLEKEIPFFEYNMCFPILSANSFEENTLKNIKQIPIGTGKYKIKNIEDGNIELILVKEEPKIYLKKINIFLEKNTSSLYHNFSKGKLDYIVTENINYEDILGTMGYNVQKIANREFDYLVLNLKNKYLRNKEIRKVISFAIDKNSINYNVFNNKYNIWNFPIYNSFLIEQSNINNFDLNKAKSILSKNGFKQIKLNLVVNSENKNRCKVAEQIKENLEKIGIKINIIKANNYLYNNYLKNKNYDILLTGKVISNSPNLEAFFAEENLSNFENEEIKQILKDINNIGESEVLKEKYNKLYNIYTEEIPFISLYSNSLFILTNRELKGDLTCNWYNLFYNIEGWYKTK